MLASVGSGPARSNGDSAQVVSVRIASSEPASPKRARTNWSVAEARYAMEIGKKPSDLTAGERAAARY